MDFSKFQDIAKQAVVNYYKENFDSYELVVNKDFNIDNVYVVWYCKTLQNAKAMLSTNIPDGMYFEVTYNGDKDELYFDAYKKAQNKLYLGADL